MVLNPNNGGGGTGFHITNKFNETYILTNKHVCGVAEYDKKTQSYWVDIVYNAKVLKRKIVALSKKHDLCLIEPIFDNGISRFATPHLALPVIVAGYGSLNPITSSVGFYRNPHIGLVCVEGGFMGCIKIARYNTDVYTTIIEGGHSGSPILSPTGALAGVVFAGDGKLTVAVPIKYVVEFISELN